MSKRKARQAARQSIALFAVSMMLAATAQAKRVFTPADIINWQPHSFVGSTEYNLTEVDGRLAIHAVCDQATASGLFLREEIDLNETPIVEWEWRDALAIMTDCDDSGGQVEAWYGTIRLLADGDE